MAHMSCKCKLWHLKGSEVVTDAADLQSELWFSKCVSGDFMGVNGASVKPLNTVHHSDRLRGAVESVINVKSSEQQDYLQVYM